MNQIRPGKVALAASTFACAALLSLTWTEQRGVSLSIESAQAHGARSKTHSSAASVPRRQARSPRGGAVAAGLTGLAAGTAAAAAASPGWGPGPGPYYGGPGYGGPAYGGGPGYGGPGYYPGPGYGGGPYYGPRAAFGAVPPATTSSTPWSLTAAYHNNGPFYGYSGWADYKSRNGIACDPGTVTNNTVCQ